MWTDGWTAFDTETTGLGSSARVVEVACVTFERGVVVREWTQMLFPDDVNWDDEQVKKALEVNGLTREELVDKPRFKDIAGDLLVELSHPVLVAHNAEFDVRMLNQELQRLGHPALSTQLLICTKNLASHIANGAKGNRLHEVAARYGVKQSGAHRAAVDAITCGNILQVMHTRGQLPREDPAMREYCELTNRAWNGKHRW